MWRRWPFVIALCVAAPASAQTPPWAGSEWAQLSIHERITIRLDRMRGPEPRAPIAQPLRWKEKKGEKCLALDSIAGASLYAPGAIDLIVKGGKRFRAKLGDECPTLDYYLGFYMKPTPDGKVCADRDAIRSRSGAVCPIHEFRKLVPAK